MKNLKLLSSFLFLLVLNLVQGKVTVSVIEYQPLPLDLNKSAHDYMLANVQKLAQVTQLECQRSDLVVWPEYALTSVDVLNLESVEDFAQDLIQDDVKDCTDPGTIVHHLRCIALRAGKYLVVNLLTRAQ